MRILFGALGLCAALTTPAFAQDAPQCMVPMEITEARVRDAAPFDFEGYAGAGAVPAFIIGGLSSSRDEENAHEVSGSAVFVPSADGAWRAFLPSPGESTVGVFVAPSTGAVTLVLQWQTEGPGQSWTVFTSRDGFATGSCVNVSFPEALNNPTWNMDSLDLGDFDIDARGRGEIVGQWASEERSAIWYVYRTRDHGATWSTPRRVRTERAARAGLYTEIPNETPAPEALVADLQRFAAGR